jgi:hypothetical protein
MDSCHFNKSNKFKYKPQKGRRNNEREKRGKETTQKKMKRQGSYINGN